MSLQSETLYMGKKVKPRYRDPELHIAEAENNITQILHSWGASVQSSVRHASQRQQAGIGSNLELFIHYSCNHADGVRNRGHVIDIWSNQLSWSRTSAVFSKTWTIVFLPVHLEPILFCMFYCALKLLLYIQLERWHLHKYPVWVNPQIQSTVWLSFSAIS